MKRKIAFFISGSLMLNGPLSTISLFANSAENTVYVDNSLEEDKEEVTEGAEADAEGTSENVEANAEETSEEAEEINEKVKVNTKEINEGAETEANAEETSENAEEINEKVKVNTKDIIEEVEANAEEADAEKVSEGAEANAEETSEKAEANAEETSEEAEGNAEETSEEAEADAEETSEETETVTEGISEETSGVFDEDTEGSVTDAKLYVENNAPVKLNLNANNADSVELSLDDGNIIITETGYSIDGNLIGGNPVDYTGAEYVITQSDSSVETSNTITVESGSNTITLKGVNMQSAATAPISITTTGDTTLLIDGENTVKTTASENAAIEKNGDSAGKLIIDKVNDDKTDILNAGSTGEGAAIGSKKKENLQNLYINGGTVNANCTGFAAGIGSGVYRSASYIYINGGIVTATSRMQGAGIGGGAYGEGHHIYINGGSVTAKGGLTGSGIGGGGAAKGSYIYINGGSVYAKGQAGAQDIGGGSDRISGTISDDNKLDNVLNNETDNQVVYLYKITGLTEGETITIDGNEMVVPAQHSSDDTYRYFYLTEESHQIVTDSFVMNLTRDNATGNFTQSIDEIDLAKGNITIKNSSFIINNSEYDYTGDYTIVQSNSETTTQNTVTVAEGSHQITIKGLNARNYTTTPFNITTSGDTTILLDGKNTLITDSTKGFAGLQKNGADTGKLIIDKVSSDDTDMLIAKGGDNGAGIGGGASCFANNIEIKGGTVNATGGDCGAGIGGGYAGYASNIVISGGNINATGGGYGAGIGGGGYAKSESDVTISGGNVVATGGDKGAGIGGGVDSNVSNIVISGGNIIATGGDCGAGIGGGFGGVVSEVYIGLAFVKATGGANAQDIGNGADEIELDNVFNNETDKKIVHLYKIDGLTEGETITVDGNAIVVPKLLDNDTNRYFYLTEGIHTFVTSKGTKSIVFNSVTNEFDEAIDVANGDIIIREKGYTYNGTFYSYTGDYIIVQSTKVVRDHRIAVDEGSHKITLKGVFIVHPSSSPFDIRTSGDTTILLDGENVLNASQTSGCAGLQKDDRNTGKLIIDKVSSDKKDSLAAFGGEYAAGIGGANKYDASDIEIRGGTIDAIGGKYAAGIGSGYWGDASNITISGGNITANFEKQSLHVGAAGIGASWGGGASNIVISGGNIQAFGSGGAGIGGGTYDAHRKGSSALNVSKIYITGGNILAIGNGSSSAGIGAGDFSAASEIYISGGFVYAAGPRAVGSCSQYESEDVYNNETDKKPVYAYKIEGLSEGQTISIDGKEIVVPESLRYAGNSGNRYVYLTGEKHTIVTPNGKKSYCI